MSILLTVVLHPSAQATPGRCADLFDPFTTRVELVKKTLDRARTELPRMLKALELDPTLLQPVKVISWGTSGVVIQANYRGRSVAVKIVHDAQPEELTEAVVIQQAFGRLGLAPKLYGTFTKESARSWLNQISATWPERFKSMSVDGAIVMEQVSAKTLKDSQFENLFEVSKDEYRHLLQQAQEIENVGAQLGVKPSDLDAVITARGDLMLLDLSYFELDHSAAGFRGDSSVHWRRGQVGKVTALVQSAVKIKQ